MKPYRIYAQPQIIDTSRPGKFYCSECKKEIGRFYMTCKHCGAEFEGEDCHDTKRTCP